MCVGGGATMCRLFPLEMEAQTPCLLCQRQRECRIISFHLARQHTGTVFVFPFSPARLTSTQGEEQLVSLARSSFFAFEE